MGIKADSPFADVVLDTIADYEPTKTDLESWVELKPATGDDVVTTEIGLFGADLTTFNENCAVASDDCDVADFEKYSGWAIGIKWTAAGGGDGGDGGDGGGGGGDPCAADPTASGCPGDPCVADPNEPGCPGDDPCAADNTLPGCPGYDPCAADNTASGCPGDPCAADPTASGCPMDPCIADPTWCRRLRQATDE